MDFNLELLMAGQSSFKEGYTLVGFNFPSRRATPEDIPNNHWVQAELGNREAIENGQLVPQPTTLKTSNGPVEATIFVPKGQS
jgi:hypothetical protein